MIIQINSLLDVGDEITNFDANPDGGHDVLDLDQLFDSLEATRGPLDAQARSNLLSFATVNGSLQVLIDEDNDASTAPILVATVTADSPLILGTTLIVDSP